MTNSERESQPTLRWQRRLLPIMTGAIAIGGAFFLIVSGLQIAYINREVARHPALELGSALRLLASVDSVAVSDAPLESARFHTQAILEAHALERRYHQANVLLLFSVQTRYMGFLTGMILALVGAVFILGKLREGESQIDAEGLAGKWGVRTTSPGIVLVCLGTILMVTAMAIKFDIEVADAPLYLRAEGGALPSIANPRDSIGMREMETKTFETLKDKLDAAGTGH